MEPDGGQGKPIVIVGWLGSFCTRLRGLMILEPRLMSAKAKLAWGGASLLFVIGGIFLLVAR